MYLKRRERWGRVGLQAAKRRRGGGGFAGAEGLHMHGLGMRLKDVLQIIRIPD